MSNFIRCTREQARVEKTRLEALVSELEGELVNLRRELAVVTAITQSTEQLKPVPVNQDPTNAVARALRRAFARVAAQ